MKDLDFDELDRAVNSLMSNVPKSAPQKTEEKVNTLDIAPTLDDADTTPPFKKVEEAAANAASGSKVDASSAIEPTPKDEVKTAEPVVPATPAPQSQPASTPASRRGGRFMDVVHPSADMSKPDAPRPVSRQGVTIEPLGASQKIADIMPKKTDAPKKAEESVEAKEEPVPAVVPPPVPSSTPEEKTETPTSDWPDPLDMMAKTEDKKEVSQGEDEPKPEESTPPLTSPFLPDTKVEKRPLGGVPSEEMPSTEVEEPDHAPVVPVDATPKTIDDPNAQLPADPSVVEPQLPEELSGDLMAVEADTTHDELKQVHESTMNEASQQTEASQPAEQKTPAATPAEPIVSSGPTSIPQQYREEPSTGDKDSVPIYDTDTYHQPLAHPAKQKSGWMWVVWIVLILLLGAGGGAALYFLGLV